MKKETPVRVALLPRRRHEELAAFAHVRIAGLWVGPERLNYLRARLETRLSKFAQTIQRLNVSLRDVNAGRGGVDKVCRIEVVMRGLPTVIVERRGVAVRATIDAALDATEQAVRRSVQRRRTRPIQRLRRAQCSARRFAVMRLERVVAT